MDTKEKLEKAIEIIESAIADFEKLEPLIGAVAAAPAEIYREELSQITQ